MTGPHHPLCTNQPVTLFGYRCLCSLGITVKDPVLPVISDVIYHGSTPSAWWYSSRPVITAPFVTYREQYRRLG